MGRRLRREPEADFGGPGELGQVARLRPAERSVTDLDTGQPLTAELVRAARGMLDWTMNDLAEASGISYSTVRRAEVSMDRIVTSAMQLMIRRAFEREGIRFIRVGEVAGLVRSAADVGNPLLAQDQR